MTKQAVTETIRICKDRNVLREYLLDREKEVVTIMMSLFDEEQIMKSFINSERYEETKENARRLLILCNWHNQSFNIKMTRICGCVDKGAWKQ